MGKAAPAIKVWAITGRDGAIILMSIRTTKRRAIHDYMAMPGNKTASWSMLKRWGWGTTQIELRPLTRTHDHG